MKAVLTAAFKLMKAQLSGFVMFVMVFNGSSPRVQV